MSENNLIAISGGIGGAKLCYGLDQILQPGQLRVIANTGDDFLYLGFYISPVPDGNLEVAGVAMNEEIDLLIEKGVNQEEVTKAVQKLQDSAIYSRDSYRIPARVLGGALAIGQTIEEVESWPERIGAVTVEAVNRAIAHVLRNRKSVTALLLPKPTT